MDKSVGVNCRVFTLQNISKLLVECYDVDTGVEFTVPVKCLSEIPDDLSGLPPAGTSQRSVCFNKIHYVSVTDISC